MICSSFHTFLYVIKLVKTTVFEFWFSVTFFYAKSKSADWLATRSDRRRGTCCVTVSSKQVQVAWNQINGFRPKNFDKVVGIIPPFLLWQLLLIWWKIWMIRLHCTLFSIVTPIPKHFALHLDLEEKYGRGIFFTDVTAVTNHIRVVWF